MYTQRLIDYTQIHHNFHLEIDIHQIINIIPISSYNSLKYLNTALSLLPIGAPIIFTLEDVYTYKYIQSMICCSHYHYSYYERKL